VWRGRSIAAVRTGSVVIEIEYSVVPTVAVMVTVGWASVSPVTPNAAFEALFPSSTAVVDVVIAVVAVGVP
jgi:hypothetical protein